MLPRILLPLLLLSLPLAGCLGGSDDGGVSPAAAPTPSPEAAPDDEGADPAPDDEGADPAGEADAVPTVEVQTFEGSITGASPTVADTFCCLWANLDGQNVQGAFSVPAGAKGLVVELVWDDATSDLDLRLDAPDYQQLTVPEAGVPPTFYHGHTWLVTAGRTGEPDRHVVIAVTDPEMLALAGEWKWTVGTKLANGVPFRLHVSVFHGEPPAEGYSAVPPA